jgi:hypothetical protein
MRRRRWFVHPDQLTFAFITDAATEAKALLRRLFASGSFEALLAAAETFVDAGTAMILSLLGERNTRRDKDAAINQTAMSSPEVSSASPKGKGAGRVRISEIGRNRRPPPS